MSERDTRGSGLSMTDQELKRRLAAKLPELIKHYPSRKEKYDWCGDSDEFITIEFWKWIASAEIVTEREWNFITEAVVEKVCQTGNLNEPSHKRYAYARELYNIVEPERQPINATWQQRAEVLAQIGVI